MRVDEILPAVVSFDESLVKAQHRAEVARWKIHKAIRRAVKRLEQKYPLGLLDRLFVEAVTSRRHQRLQELMLFHKDDHLSDGPSAMAHAILGGGW